MEKSTNPDLEVTTFQLNPTRVTIDNKEGDADIAESFLGPKDVFVDVDVKMLKVLHKFICTTYCMSE